MSSLACLATARQATPDQLGVEAEPSGGTASRPPRARPARRRGRPQSARGLRSRPRGARRAALVEPVGVGQDGVDRRHARSAASSADLGRRQRSQPGRLGGLAGRLAALIGHRRRLPRRAPSCPCGQPVTWSRVRRCGRGGPNPPRATTRATRRPRRRRGRRARAGRPRLRTASRPRASRLPRRQRAASAAPQVVAERGWGADSGAAGAGPPTADTGHDQQRVDARRAAPAMSVSSRSPTISGRAPPPDARSRRAAAARACLPPPASPPRSR